MTWTCPHCGSSDLFAYFSERRGAPIDQSITTAPTPDVNNDDFCDGPFDLNVICHNCGETNLTPILQQPTEPPKEQPMTHHTLSIDVRGGVAYLYDPHTPPVLQPGDTLTIEVHDYDCDDDASLPRDEAGDPFAPGDSLTFTVAT